MLIKTLKNYWFSEKEAKVYLACLELWNALVSSIARHSGEHRITTYSILKDLKKRWISQELTKNKVKYFSVINPEQLLLLEEKKVEKLKKIMPELLAISNAFGNKPKVYFYEWREKLQNLFLEILKHWETMTEPFLSFTGTENIDKEFEKFLVWEFREKRSKIKIWTKVIMSDINWVYNKYHYESDYETVTISDPIFEMWNEIALYWKNKIAILNYKSWEIYGLIIESDTLFKTFKSMFNLIWKTYKK
jgi:sugar-specific transcriptional regulator TrmB